MRFLMIWGYHEKVLIRSFDARQCVGFEYFLYILSDDDFVTAEIGTGSGREKDSHGSRRSKMLLTQDLGDMRN